MSQRDPGAAPGPATRLFTFGHSTRSLEEAIDTLRAHGVGALVDVRRFPGSRRLPHFGRDQLAPALAAAGLEYVWEEDLGGRRRRREGSPHTAWRVASFAAYADHMDSPEFIAAAERVMATAARVPTAVMCAEARPEQCHRRLIADWMTVRGVEVLHLMTPTRAVPHRVPDFARVEDGRLVYDG